MQQPDGTNEIGSPTSICVYVFGPLGIEWRGHPAPFPAERLRGKGSASALALLKALICQPRRFAPRDWILEQFWPDSPRKTAEERLHDVATVLRQILCPTSTTKILHYVHGGPRSGSGYQLESHPHLWVDADAFGWYVEQAIRQDRFGQPSLALWEQAYQLASRGPFLPEDCYANWASPRRQEIEGRYRQCVHRLAALLREAGYTEEAILRLRAFWVSHPTDEDALRPLMELLGEQERFGEALEYYQRLVTVLAEDHLTPDERTQDVMQMVSTQQIHRQRAVSLPLPRVTEQLPMLAATRPLTIWLEGQQEALLTVAAAEMTHGPAETRHLIGREAWLTIVLQMLQGNPAKKLLILHGPIGVGKTSELSRLANEWRRTTPTEAQVVKITLPLAESGMGPEVVLDLVLGTLLSEYHHPALPATASQQMRLNCLLSRLAQHTSPGLILLDNAECLLIEDGRLAPCWEAFLTQFIRGQHQTTLLIATKEWHGWPGRDRLLVAEYSVPPLTQEESVRLLQHLGLEAVSVEHLQTRVVAVAYLPLCLEWIAQLAHDPLVLDDWSGWDDGEGDGDDIAQRFLHLLENPSRLEDHLANKLAPLLRRIIETRLSHDALCVLERLAVSSIPLGKPALQMLCPRPV